MMNQDIAIAKKYAQAYINVYPEQITQQLAAHIQSFVSFLKARRTVLFYMQLASIPQETIQSTLYHLLASYHVSGSLTVLVDMLIKDKRISLLPQVFEALIALYKERHHIVDFVIASSHQLSEKQLERLKNFLEKKLHKEIHYKAVIDKRLIAGIKMYSDNWYWEHSIRRQLNGLSTVKE